MSEFFTAIDTCRKTMVLGVLASIFMLTHASSSFAVVTWEQVPLRTQDQIDAMPSEAGGEGLQMTWDIVYSPNNTSTDLSNNTQTVYMLKDTQWVWKSINSGSSWFSLPISAENPGGGGVSMIAIKKSDIGLSDDGKDVLLVASSAHDVNGLVPVSGGGIYRNVGGVGDWNLASGSSGFDFYRPDMNFNSTGSHLSMKGGDRFAVDAMTNTIYAGTGNSGIVSSTDGGINWSAWDSGINATLSDYDILDVKILPNRNMIIVGWEMHNTPREWMLHTEGNPIVKMFMVDLTNSTLALTEVITDQSGVFFPRFIQKNPCDETDNTFYVALGDYGVGMITLDSPTSTLTLVNGNLPGSVVDNTPNEAAVGYLKISNTCNDGNYPAQMQMSVYRAWSAPSQHYVSFDGGVHWIGSSNDLADSLGALNIPDGMNVIAIDPQTNTNSDPTLRHAVLASGYGNAIVKSTDGGAFWFYSNTGVTGAGTGGTGSAGLDSTNKATNPISFQDENNFAVFLTDYGAIKHSDTGAFAALCDDFNACSGTAETGAISTTSTTNGQTIVTAVPDSSHIPRLIYSLDGGESWVEPEDSTLTTTDKRIVGKLKFIQFAGEAGYVEKFYANNYKMTIDHSTTPATVLFIRLFRPVFDVDGAPTSATHVPAAIIGIDNNGTLYSAAILSGHIWLYYSTDSGVNWDSIKNSWNAISAVGTIPTGVKTKGIVSSSFQQIVVSNDGSRIYVSSDDSNNKGVWKCHVTSDDGKTCVWKYSTYPSSTRALVINPANANEVCTTSDEGVSCIATTTTVPTIDEDYVWDDTWTALNFQYGAISLSANPFNGDLYVGSLYGIWVARNAFADTDDDGISNYLDLDDDNDGVWDVNDAYPLISLDGRTDTDHDGRPDDCDTLCLATGMTADTDDDNDGVLDTADNCTLVFNPLQLDLDADGYGNACDGDVNNDGVVDAQDLRLIISAYGNWVSITNLLGFPMLIPSIAPSSEINRQAWYQWQQEGSSYEPGPSGLHP